MNFMRYAIFSIVLTSLVSIPMLRLSAPSGSANYAGHAPSSGLKIHENTLERLAVPCVASAKHGGDEKTTNAAVRYGNEQFSHQDLSELTQILNVINAVQEGDIEKAVTLSFTQKIYDALSLIPGINNQKNK